MKSSRIQIPRRELSLILAIALILLVIITGLLMWKDYQSADISFQQESVRLYDDLSKSLSDINAILNGMVALHNAVDTVDAEQFSLYSHEMLNVYPNINAIKLLTRVEDGFRDIFRMKMRQDGFPTFDIYEGEGNKPDEWKPAASRPLYYPITAIEPLEPDKIISMGFDLYSVPEFRETIDYSIRTGESASAKCIALMKGVSSIWF